MADKTIEKREESLRVFNQAAPMYDRIGPGIFSYFGQRLIDVAEIPNGANVLDVAAGRGVVFQQQRGSDQLDTSPESTLPRTWCVRQPMT